jgi:hypothetical protein
MNVQVDIALKGGIVGILLPKSNVRVEGVD